MSLAVSGGLGYLTGSIPAGYLVGRLRGVDLRREGSGNVGATNAARALGWRWGALVFTLDAAKGWAAAGPVATWLAAGAPATLLGLVGGLAAVAGHCWSPWLGLDGGKGVATGLGALLVWSPPAALAAVLVWLCVALRVRVVSVASLAAVGAVLLIGPATASLRGQDALRERALAFVALATIVGWRHRPNLARLRAGSEPPMTPETPGDSRD